MNNRTYQIRKWVGKGMKQKVVIRDIETLQKAFIEYARLERDNPKEKYSIYLTPRGEEKKCLSH